MNNLKLAYRNLFRKKQNNLIKILSLGTGLAISLVLLTKVTFENNYDDFYPDNERIYRVETRLHMSDEPKEYGLVSGAIAPGIKAEVPGVETATRFTPLVWGASTFYTKDKNRYKGELILADEHFFEIFPRPMIVGEAKETLSHSMHAIISDKMAAKMGNDVIGKVIEVESYPGKEITIGGVFKAIPENSSNRYDVVVSLKSISNFSWDGSDNWVGNDRYHGYVKLEKGVDPNNLGPAIRQMQEKNQPMEEMRKSGVDITYTLIPLPSIHSGSKEVKNITLVLSIIAFALLLTSVLNYLLIMITTLLQRSKEVAVNKCYGASGWSITRLISAETLLHFALALIFGALLLFFFQSTVEEILGASLISLFSSKAILLLLVVLTVVFIISVVIPTSIMMRIPLATIFRTNKRMQQSWKLVLLFVQFGAAAFLLTLTASVSKQYNHMISDNPGYDYKNTGYVDLPGVDSIQKQTLSNTLNTLSSVELTSFTSTLPIYNMSGNNVYVEGNDKELFNIADMYFADENFLPLMNIPLVAGRNFDKSDNIQSLLVSESFIEKIQNITGWDDVVGKDVTITEHPGLSRIVGVFPDIRISSFGNQDSRPSVLHFSGQRADILHSYKNYLLVKLNSLDDDNLRRVTQTVNEILPDREASLIPYSESIIKSYDKERLFRNTILIGAIITLIISLIGLIGYINNEIAYRTAEIAIRKINGATLNDILQLFLKNIIYIALPAIVVGLVAASFVSNKWMENFSEQWQLTFWQYLIGALALLLIIEVAVIVNSIKTANQNPVESLKKN